MAEPIPGVSTNSSPPRRNGRGNSRQARTTFFRFPAFELPHPRQYKTIARELHHQLLAVLSLPLSDMFAKKFHQRAELVSDALLESRVLLEPGKIRSHPC